MRSRLGWLGPAIVIIGLVVGGVGIYIMASSRPQPGAFLDVIALGDRGALAVRAQIGSDRNFVELYENGAGMRWQALVPPYAGSPATPGIQTSVRLVNVRVTRDGRAELFSLALADSVKIGGLHLVDDAWPASPTGYSLPSGLNFESPNHAYQVVGDATHGAVFEISRTDGTTTWRYLAPGGIRGAYAVGDERVAVENVDGSITMLDGATGRVTSDPVAVRPAPAKTDLTFDAAARVVRIAGRGVRWPDDALPPQPHHYVASTGLLWMVMPTRLAVIDTLTMTVRWTSDGAPLPLTPAP